MADDTLKRLLIKLGIDTSEWQTAVKDIKRQLDELYAQEKVKATERRATQQQDATAMKQQSDLGRKVAEAAVQQVKVMREQGVLRAKDVERIREEIAKEKSKLDIKQAQLKIMVAEGQISQTVFKNLEKELGLERQKLSLQLAQLRAQSAQGGQPGWLFRDTLRGATSGLFGGGLLGGVAGGAFAGTLFGQGVYEIAKLMAEKVKEIAKTLVEASGGAQTMRLEFEKLATGRGSDPAALLQKLRVATRGLVDDTQLFTLATRFMRSGVKASDDQITKLIGTTLALAQQSNKSVPEAMHSLERAFATGRFQMVAYATGLTTADLKLKNLPRSMDAATRKTLEFNAVLAAEEKAIKKVGEPARTLPDLLNQVTVTEKNFIDGIVEGLLHTSKFGDTIQGLSKRLIELQPKIIEFAKRVGEDLADAIKFVADHGKEIKVLLEVLVQIKIGEWVLGVASAFNTWGTAIAGVITKLGILKTAEVASEVSGVGVAGAKVGTTVAETAGGTAAGTLATRAVAALGGVAGLVAIAAAVISGLGLAWLLKKLEEHGASPAEQAATSTRVWAAQRGTGSPVGGRTFGSPQEVAQSQGLFGLLKPLPAPTGPAEVQTEAPEPPDWDVLKARQEANLKEQETLNQIALDKRKRQIAEELDALKQSYDQGTVYLKDYLAREDALNEQERKARKDEIAQNAADKIAELRATQVQVVNGVPVQMRDPVAEATAERTVLEKAEDDKLKIDEEYDKKHRAVKARGYADALAAQKEFNAQSAQLQHIYEQEVITLAKNAAAERQKVLEDQFKSGKIGPEAYLAGRQTVIEQERDLQLKELQQEAQDAQAATDEKLKLAVKSEAEQTKIAGEGAKEQANIRVKGINVVIDAQKQLAQLQRDEDKIRLEGLQNEYNRVRQLFEAQKEFGVAGVAAGQPGARGSEIAAMEQLQSLNEAYLKQLKEQLLHEDAGSEEWVKILKAETAVTAEQQKLNEELAKMKDFFTPLAATFSDIGRAIAPISKELGSWFESVSKTMQELSDFNRQVALQGGGLASLKQLGGSFLGLFRHGAGVEGEAQKTGTQVFEEKLVAASTTTQQFSTTMQSAIASLKEFIAGLQDSLTKVKEKAIGTVPTIPSDISQFPLVPSSGGDTAPPQGAFFGSLPTGTAPADGGTGPLQAIVGTAKDVAGAFTEVAKSGHESKGSLDNLSTKYGEFQANLSKWIAGIGAVIGSIAGAKSTGGGIVSGGLSGAQFGAAFGPWGAAIGFAVGATLGGVIGSKVADAKKDADIIKNQLQNIVNQLNAGTITLGDAIAALRKERQAALDMLGGDKKGGKQLPAVLSAIDSQLQSLLSQQKQTLDNLHQQLIVLSEPTAFQQYVTQLDDIIKKYQEFASAAAGNAAEVANAQLFLQLSLKQYAETLSTDVNNAEQGAIQDAIKLLDLQQQRAKLLQDEQTQEYDILTGGTLSRQRSEAQTKGAQIEALQAQFNQQMDVINQEIALTTYKVQSEQKIYNLATDRIGLETELLALQEVQVDKSTAQTEALQQVLQAVMEAVATGNLPSAITGAGSLATGTDLLSQITQLLGLPPSNIPPGALIPVGDTDYLAELPLQWRSDAQLVNDIRPNFLHYLIEGLTGDGASRTNAYNLAGSVWKDLQNADPNAMKFIQWIQTGTLPAGTAAPPLMAQGGHVGKTGLAVIHEGETVLPATGGSGRIGDLVAQHFASTTGTDVTKPHEYILNLAMKRIALEHELLGAQAAHIQLDMQRMAYLEKLMNKAGTTGDAVTSLEGGLAKIYELRGRYGSAGFRRETL